MEGSHISDLQPSLTKAGCHLSQSVPTKTRLPYTCGDKPYDLPIFHRGSQQAEIMESVRLDEDSSRVFRWQGLKVMFTATLKLRLVQRPQ